MGKCAIIRFAACAAVVVATSATLPLCAAEVAAFYLAGAALIAVARRRQYFRSQKELR